MKTRSPLMTLLPMLLFASFSFLVANAETLFVDDFEGGTKGKWVFADLEGKGKWGAAKFEGRGVFKVDSIGAWTGATVAGVASLKDHDELWATCKFKCEQDIGSCNELGLLTNPKELRGNWYLATCEGGGEVGIDECGVAWHGRVPYKWELDKWYNMKIMVSKDKTMYGKMWPEGGDEPSKWLTQETLTSRLDEDGVGLMSYHCITYFDDVIVASSEESLVPKAVSPKGKLAVSWCKIKSR